MKGKESFGLVRDKRPKNKGSYSPGANLNVQRLKTLKAVSK